jgi:hypothetical protein
MIMSVVGWSKEDALQPPPSHQTVHADFPHTAFVWHYPIAGDGFIN